MTTKSEQYLFVMIAPNAERVWVVEMGFVATCWAPSLNTRCSRANHRAATEIRHDIVSVVIWGILLSSVFSLS